VAHIVYIGTYTSGDSQGIYKFVFENGMLRMLGAIKETNPSYLIATKDRLYSVREMHGGSVVSYQLLDDGTHEMTGQQVSMGDAPCHLYLDGSFLYAANYTSGSLAEFTLGEQMQVKKLPRLFIHEGSSAHFSRQTGPHVHFSAITPDKRYLAVCDLGTDKVLFYRYTSFGISNNGIELVNLPPGYGPRHAVFGDNDMWYLVCELSCKLVVFQGYGTQAKPVQELSLLQSPDPLSSGAAVKLSPDRKRLLVSVRGANNLVLMNIGSDGLLKDKTFTCSCGDWPRDAAFSPCGEYILCACERSNIISIFKLTSKELVFAGSAAVPSPACICFVAT